MLRASKVQATMRRLYDIIQLLLYVPNTRYIPRRVIAAALSQRPSQGAYPRGTKPNTRRGMDNRWRIMIQQQYNITTWYHTLHSRTRSHFPRQSILLTTAMLAPSTRRWHEHRGTTINTTTSDCTVVVLIWLYYLYTTMIMYRNYSQSVVSLLLLLYYYTIILSYYHCTVEDCSTVLLSGL